MTLIVNQGGAVVDLNYRRQNLFVNAVCKLYQNNYIPTVLSVLANFTEANFSGYASQVVAWPNPAFLDVGGFARVDASTLTWSHSGGPAGNSIYGYYLLKATGELLWAERFPTVVPMVVLGQSVLLTVSQTYQSLFSG